MDWMNLILYIAFVIDLRYKIKSMAYSLKMCKRIKCRDRIEAQVRLFLNLLIGQYNRFHELSRRRSNVAYRSSSSIINDDLNFERFDTSLKQYFEVKNSLIFGSEVDRYLLVGIKPKTPEFNILT